MPEEYPAAPRRRRPPWRWLVLAVAAVVCAAGYRLTNNSGGAAPTVQGGLSPSLVRPLLRDERLFQTAQQMAGLADTSGQQPFAAQAQEQADEVVDTSFSIALAQVAAQPEAPQAADRETAARVDQAQAAVTADKNAATAAEQALAKAKANQRPQVQGELAIAQAQLSLDQDRLQDAINDASRSGTGAAERITQMKQQHEASHAGGQHAVAVTPPPLAGTANGLIGELSRVWQRTSELHQLQTAEASVRSAATQMVAAHDQLHEQVAVGEARLKAAPAGGVVDGKVSTLHQLEQEQQQVARYDQQVDTAGELAETYHQWQPMVVTSRQRALHESLRLVLILLGIVAALLVLLHLWARLLTHPRWDRKRVATLHHLLNLSTEILAGLAALIVLFGKPPQILTVLGLVGAGLTVAFQDAILSVGGWFILMGRNGVRMGDWVEINGVVGEVIEVRLLTTVLLETGNWIAAGHPTGRRVFFPNNFALKGNYFNYSTAGQWLWDQLEVPVPAGTDAHAMVARIAPALQAELQPLSERARIEWQHLHSGASGADTAPVVFPRPGSGGTVLVVRYTTPARQRTAMRQKVWNLIEGASAGEGTPAGAAAGN